MLLQVCLGIIPNQPESSAPPDPPTLLSLCSSSVSLKLAGMPVIRNLFTTFLRRNHWCSDNVAKRSKEVADEL